ncbi:MAG: efflux RND transporter permease subunit, partial [Alphaproteobacteria bacterium]|nr:efflux RND transporter permease subunit [Alphaproteobacteria bacterium]
MTISEFFIKRPIFAIVLNVLFIVVGLLSYRSLTVREYPEVSTPSLTVRISYPNASPQVIESEVTFLVEDALAEVPNLSLMASSSKEGESEVRLKFKEGTSVNSVLSKVRESLAQIKSDLPKDVQDPKIRQEANETQALIYVSLTSDHLESSDLTHLANLHLKNAFRSLSGVASVDVIGRPYVMEIALDRLKMFSFGVTPKGISKALEDHNVALPSGKLAGEIPVTMDLKAKSDEDFGSIVVKQKDGDVVFLRDVADIRLKDDDSWRIRVNGNPGILLGIKRAGDGNPLEISRDVREILPGLQKNLSEGVYAEIVKDDADFIRASLSSIKNSLIEAVVLVLLIIFLFLRNLRASLIPLVTIPVSVLGTFAILSLFGFSINTITLLALVLAIGLVVDDAIVVLENIFRHVEAGMSPQEAAKKGSKEISFAIVAMTGTLASVYAPIAFMQGAMGQIFVEFAVALAGAVLVSGVVALTLSPMMCSNILRAHNGEVLPSISKFIQRLTDNYKNLLGRVMLYPRWIMGGACLLLALCVVFFKILPGELAPKEDRGVLGVFMEPLTASSKEVMDEYVKKAETLVKDVPEAKQNLTFIGDWGGNVVLPLKSWSDRGRSAGQITEDLREKVRVIPTVSTHVWNWDSGLPGLEGMGEDSDITLYVLTVGTYEELLNRIEKFTKECRDDGVFKSVYHRLKLGEPGYNCVIDRQKMAKADFEPEDISKALEIFLDRAKSTSFYKEGQKYDVRLTGQDSPQDLSEVYVSNKEGARVSLASFAT